MRRKADESRGHHFKKKKKTQRTDKKVLTLVLRKWKHHRKNVEFKFIKFRLKKKVS